MNVTEFLKLTSEILECENEIEIDDDIEDIDEWDSLGVLSIISMLDEMGITLALDQFENIETIKDYIDLVGISDNE